MLLPPNPLPSVFGGALRRVPAGVLRGLASRCARWGAAQSPVLLGTASACRVLTVSTVGAGAAGVMVAVSMGFVSVAGGPQAALG